MSNIYDQELIILRIGSCSRLLLYFLRLREAHYGFGQIFSSKLLLEEKREVLAKRERV